MCLSGSTRPFIKPTVLVAPYYSFSGDKNQKSCFLRAVEHPVNGGDDDDDDLQMRKVALVYMFCGYVVRAHTRRADDVIKRKRGRTKAICLRQYQQIHNQLLTMKTCRLYKCVGAIELFTSSVGFAKKLCEKSNGKQKFDIDT